MIPAIARLLSHRCETARGAGLRILGNPAKSPLPQPADDRRRIEPPDVLRVLSCIQLDDQTIVGRRVQAVLEPDGDVSLPLLIDRLHAGREERKTGRFDQDLLADADRQVLPKLHDAGIERQADEPSRKRSPREASLGRFVYGKTINRRAGLFKTDEGGDDEHDDVGASPEHRYDRKLAFDYWRPFGNEIDDDPERGERDQGSRYM